MPSVVPVSGLNPRAERRLRVLSTLTVLVLAVAAAVLSFTGLRDLAIASGIPAQIAWLLPLVVDGMVLTGSLGVIASALTGIATWYPWFLTLFGVAASIAGNVLAAPPDTTSRLVHAMAPTTFALSIEGLLRIYRAAAVASAERERARLAREEAEAARAEAAAERAARAEARAQRFGGIPVSGDVGFGAAEGRNTKDLAGEILAGNPEIKGGELARRLGIDPSYARKLLRDLRSEQPAPAPVAPSAPTLPRPPVQPGPGSE